MSSPYIGEIRMFGGNFAPNGWAFCNGQLLPIAENDALFALIGTTYGGDGETTFALPDLRSRVPIHQGTGSSGTSYQPGGSGGGETVTLTTSQIPIHNHALTATTTLGNETNPAENVLAQSTRADMYEERSPNAQLAPNALSPAGGSQPHDNIQPYLAISFIISLFGIFPSQT